MNISYILLLPNDILKQIPPSYRIWKLLQMTCCELNDRLGSYHVARDIYPLVINTSNINDGIRPISYNALINKLIAYTQCRQTSSRCGLFTECEWFIDDNGNRQLESYGVGIEWDGNALVYWKDGREAQYITICECPEVPYILMGDVKYVSGRHMGPIASLYKQIYDELPKLYSTMRVVRALTCHDFMSV